MNNTARIIPLTQGKFAAVSPEDYDYLSRFNWCAMKKRTTFGYLWCAVRCLLPKNRLVYMHREIARRARLKKSKEYDHRDRNGLNNTRENIRPCTRSQNVANRTKSSGKSSKYKGVSWGKKNHKWDARIRCNGKQFCLGLFENEEDAAQAYAVAAVRLFGEFAHF